jgi:hypothetical protein
VIQKQKVFPAEELMQRVIGQSFLAKINFFDLSTSNREKCFSGSSKIKRKSFSGGFSDAISS